MERPLAKRSFVRWAKSQGSGAENEGEASRYHQGVWDDDCEHEYSYSCECKCEHWCWHEYEHECRAYHCDCDGYTKESDDEGDESDSAPFTLKDAAVVAGGAALVFGALKIFGKKSSDEDPEDEDENSAVEAPSGPTQSMAILPTTPSATPPRTLPPAGWYQDGRSERSRWWDGAAWTDHFQPLAGPAAPVAAVSPTVQPGWYDDGRGHLRWWDGRNWTHHIAR